VTHASHASEIPVTVQLQLLGSLRLSAPDGRDLDSLVRQPKRTALLAYLAAAVPRGFQRRDSLLALFWPELDDAHARAALNQALYVLRNALGEQAIVTRGDGEVGLSGDVISCDVAQFEDALDGGRPAEALALYGADLLQGFFVSDAPGFERWLETERGRLRQRASEGAWAVAEATAAEGDAVEAARWARRATDLLTTADEAAARRLMTFLHRLGDRAAALRAYEGFAWRLRGEYELEPSAETRALALAFREEGRHPAAVRFVKLAGPVPAILVAIQRRLPLAWIGASLVALGLGAGAWAGLRRTQPLPRPVVRFGLQFPGAALITSGVPGSTIALSPDGGRLVYLAEREQVRQLFLRGMDQLEAVPIPHTRDAYLPFFSPDGEWLGFVAEGRIRRVPLDGGPAITVCTVGASVMGASWGPGGEIVFATEAGLWRVSADGGSPRVIAAPDTARGVRYRWPQALPGGRTAVFTRVDSSGYQVAAVSLETGTVQALGLEGTNPHFVEPRYLVFARQDGALLAVSFDHDALEITGPVLPVAEGITVGLQGAAKLGIARAGTLALVPERLADRVLVIVDRAGREQRVPVPPQGYHAARFSADGRRIVTDIVIPEGAGRDVAVFDTERHTLRRVTSDRSSAYPNWTPDGRKVVFATSSGGRLPGFEIRSVSADGSDTAETLVGAERSQTAEAFTPDGRSLVVAREHPDKRRDLWILTLEPQRTLMPYLSTPADDRAAALSPDGRWLAYTSDESGRDEVYVRSFPVPGAAVRVSEAGGREPRWASTGRELFYRSETGMMAATVRVTSAFTIEDRDVLFDDRPYVAISNGAAYDVHPDGGQFLMIRRGPQVREIVVVLNWFDQLRTFSR